MTTPFKVLAMAIEPEATFGLDPGGTFNRLDILEPLDIPLPQEMLMAGPNFALTNRAPIPGNKRGAISFKIPLRGTGTAAEPGTNATGPSAVSATGAGGDLANLLCLSGFKLSQAATDGGTIQSQNGTTITLDTGEGALFPAGQGLRKNAVSASVKAEVNFSKSVASETVTLERTQAYTTGTPTVQNSSTYYHKQAVSELANLPTVTVYLYGVEATYKFYGCALVLQSITGSAGQRIEAEVTMMFADWEVAAAGTPPTFSATFHTGLSHLVMADSCLYVDDAEHSVAEVILRFGIDAVPLNSACGPVSGIGGYIVQAYTPEIEVVGDLLTNADATVGPAAMDAGTSKQVMGSFGNSSGNAVGFFADTARIVSYARVNENGRAGARIIFAPNLGSVHVADLFVAVF